MKKVESKVARKWYEYLAEGKMMALRCKDCGTYHFPAFPICHGCGKHDMEWVEISGDAVVTDLADVKFMSSGIDLNNLMSDAQKTTGVSKADSRPCSIQLKEGPVFNCRVYGVSSENKEEVWNKIPCPVKAFIVDKGDFKTVGFMYDPE